MAFSMGQNFLNSPGAQLMGALGVHLPGAQQQVNPVQQPMTFQPGPQIDPNADYSHMDLPAIPAPPHGGFLHRLMAAFTGGAGA